MLYKFAFVSIMCGLTQILAHVYYHYDYTINDDVDDDDDDYNDEDYRPNSQ